jgi:predicted alpha/beta-fold hydrolase
VEPRQPAPTPPGPYRAPSWLRLTRFIGDTNCGHWQTIAPALITKHLSTPGLLPMRRERWESTPGGTPDGDFIDIDFLDAPAGTPLVVLFHGLEGSAHSHYARALIHAVLQRGWAGAVVHFRGCSGEPNRLPRAYHSGDATEIAWILKRMNMLAEQQRRDLLTCGVSLGGNALARWLGEAGASAGFVRGAAVVSAPLDLAAGGAALGRGFNMVYTRMFLATLKTRLMEKIRRHPELAHLRGRIAEIKSARDLHAYDNLYTAPVHGYLDTDDYWKRASAKPVLKNITVPTLIINARNDPFMPARALPTQVDVSGAVTLEQPAEGGHVGFATGAFPGRIDWMPRRVLAFFDEQLKAV